MAAVLGGNTGGAETYTAVISKDLVSGKSTESTPLVPKEETKAEVRYAHGCAYSWLRWLRQPQFQRMPMVMPLLRCRLLHSRALGFCCCLVCCQYEVATALPVTHRPGCQLPPDPNVCVPSLQCPNMS